MINLGWSAVGVACRLAAYPLACAALWLHGPTEEEQGLPGLFPSFNRRGR